MLGLKGFGAQRNARPPGRDGASSPTPEMPATSRIVSRWFAGSFLLGWLIKWLILRYGSQRIYREARRFFIGMIAGEMLAGLFWMAVGGIYYVITKTPPPLFRVHL